MTDELIEYQPISAVACSDGDILITQPDPEAKIMRHMVICEGQVSRFVDELIIALENIADRISLEE